MTLQQYINSEYQGNTSAYARDLGTSYTQVKRWVSAGCMVFNGQLLKPVYYTHNETKLITKA